MLDFAFWVLGFGFWVLGFGFWILVLDFGFWILDFGFGILGFGALARLLLEPPPRSGFGGGLERLGKGWGCWGAGAWRSLEPLEA